MPDRDIWIGFLPAAPLGPIGVAVTQSTLYAVAVNPDPALWPADLTRRGVRLTAAAPPPLLDAALAQLAAYLAGTRRAFDLPLPWDDLRPFQRAVLQATYALPYGATTTYGALAAQIGQPRAARAVGRAQATNPIPLVIPCHRVLGRDGGLRGYGQDRRAGGVTTKAWLLALEAGARS
jgi:methylated-DNA-[protein]-cysteine S-methyltransferase